MKYSIIYFFTITLSLSALFLNAQGIQNLNDIHFERASFNTAFIIQKEEPLNISLTSSLGSGVQNVRRYNLLMFGNNKKLEVGFGLRINSAFYSIFNNTTIETLYAKDFSINDSHRFYVGLNFGMNYIGLNTKLLNQYVDQADPVVSDNNFPQYRFTAGFGVGYEIEDRLLLGFSVPSLIKTKNDFRPDFIFNLLYKKGISETFRVEPEVLLYSSALYKLTAELNTSLVYYDILAFRIGARTNKSMLFGFRWVREVVKIGYIYNLNFDKYQSVNPGVHNINVAYVFE